MKQTRLMMGMPITVEVVDSSNDQTINRVFEYFDYIDHKFSTYKTDSEISLYNQKKITSNDFSEDMVTVFKLSDQTKQETNGFFNIFRRGIFDPSGLVKGWAILNAAQIIADAGFKNYYVEAGGDIQVNGLNAAGKRWSVGIRNPFDQSHIVKVISATGLGIATSGTYIRGQHVYNPHDDSGFITDIVSLTVIGPNIYEADRFATAAFAMGKEGINFLEKLPGFEAYQIDAGGVALYTSGFEKFITKLWSK